MPGLNKQLVFTNSTITVDGASVGATYDIPLGDPSQYLNEENGFFTISGTPTLSTSLTITTGYTPTTKTWFTFLSRASVNLNGNTITIFGISLTQSQASSPFVIDAWYDGVTWSASISRLEISSTGLTNGQMAQMGSHTIKMNSGASPTVPQDVTYEQFRASVNLDYDLINCVVDFNSGFLQPIDYRQDILIPYAGEVTRVFGYVTEAIENTDDAVIEFGIAGSPGGGYSTFSTLTFSAGSPMNTSANDLSPATPDNEFSANNYLAIIGQKTTWGGRVICTIVTKRT